jgi:hypothetical protein
LNDKRILLFGLPLYDVGLISRPTYIVRLDIPMHDTHAMAVVQGLQKLVQIIPDIVVRQCLKGKETINDCFYFVFVV